jgi:Cysteine-rich CWC
LPARPIIQDMADEHRKQPRRLACARCGAAFDCGLDAGCWCRDEPYRLPMSQMTNEDCLCPACLRRVAAAGPSPASN